MTRGLPPRNFFDDHLDRVVDSMFAAADGIDTMAGPNAPPFDAKRLTPAEADLAYDNPAGVFYPRDVDAATGQPLTNAQAAQRLLAEHGPVWYVDWVQDNELRRARAAREGQGEGVLPDGYA